MAQQLSVQDSPSFLLLFRQSGMHAGIVADCQQIGAKRLHVTLWRKHNAALAVDVPRLAAGQQAVCCSRFADFKL
jgi:hypothetical protein